jgi:hypothetical protein
MSLILSRLTLGATSGSSHRAGRSLSVHVMPRKTFARELKGLAQQASGEGIDAGGCGRTRGRPPSLRSRLLGMYAAHGRLCAHWTMSGCIEVGGERQCAD